MPSIPSELIAASAARVKFLLARDRESFELEIRDTQNRQIEIRFPVWWLPELQEQLQNMRDRIEAEGGRIPRRPDA